MARRDGQGEELGGSIRRSVVDRPSALGTGIRDLLWDLKPENLILPYRVAAADMPLRKGVLSFDEDSELVRLGDELGLRSLR
jgi:hypothetical protein